MADLTRRLDAARFAHSEAVLQYTRVANENIRLQQDLRRNAPANVRLQQTNSEFILRYCTASKFQHDHS